jgi:hypothetical protein
MCPRRPRRKFRATRIDQPDGDNTFGLPCHLLHEQLVHTLQISVDVSVCHAIPSVQKCSLFEFSQLPSWSELAAVAPQGRHPVVPEIVLAM